MKTVRESDLFHQQMKERQAAATKTKLIPQEILVGDQKEEEYKNDVSALGYDGDIHGAAHPNSSATANSTSPAVVDPNKRLFNTSTPSQQPTVIEAATAYKLRREADAEHARAEKEKVLATASAHKTKLDVEKELEVTRTMEQMKRSEDEKQLLLAQTTAKKEAVDSDIRLLTAQKDAKKELIHAETHADITKSAKKDRSKALDIFGSMVARGQTPPAELLALLMPNAGPEKTTSSDTAQKLPSTKKPAAEVISNTARKPVATISSKKRKEWVVYSYHDGDKGTFPFQPDGNLGAGYVLRNFLGASCKMPYKLYRSGSYRYWYPFCQCRGKSDCRLRVWFDDDKQQWALAIDRSQLFNLHHENGEFIIGGKSPEDYSD